MALGRAAYPAALAMALTTGPVFALTPLPPPCVYDLAKGRVALPDAAPPGSPYAHETRAGEDFVAWSVAVDQGRDYVTIRLALQHCPSGRELLIVPPRQGYRPVEELFYAMIASYESYTMRQIGDAAAKLGAKVRHSSRHRLGRCVCDAMGR